jgi:cysteine desulfuration protein SufE
METHASPQAGPEIEAEKRRIIEEFSAFDDWVGRYEYIVELGSNLPKLPDSLKTEANRVLGCQSRVWFVPTVENGRIRFAADSDAVLVRGLIALLLRIYSDRAPDDILATSPKFFEEIELGSHLTGSRANGLHAMVKRIQAIARELQGKADSHASGRKY